MAALGTGVSEHGRLQPDRMVVAVEALKRFALLCREMGVAEIEAYATAAVRLADNGWGFVEAVKHECGIDIRVIDGEREGYFSAMGVLAGIPLAEGVVGDLGGGSLELARIEDGRPTKVTSLPIGSLKLAEARAAGPKKLAKLVRKALDTVDWAGEGNGLPFYMVGGSWRALAQLHMHLTDAPLPIAQQYELTTKAIDRLARAVPNLSEKRLASVRQLSTERIPHLPGAALLLRKVMKRLGSSHGIVSSYGIREGIFFDGLPEGVAVRDPFLAAAREEGRSYARFPKLSTALFDWTEPLFADDPDEEDRIRRGACELSDVAWRAHPDFKAERAMEIALHGNWVNIDARGRAQLAAALFALNGGGVADPARAALAQILPYEVLDRASAWGLAIRLGQRLAGGTVTLLEKSSIRRTKKRVELHLAKDFESLVSPAVEKRLQQLALHLGTSYQIKMGK